MKKPNVPFVNEVEDFNSLMSKPNNYTPVIPEKKEWQFVYDFVLEELEEYKQACEKGDIVEILDALCDIAYVSLGNGTMLHGLKDKISVFEVIILEVSLHQYNKSAPLFDEIFTYMNDSGFRLYDIYDLKRLGNYKNSFLLQFDCVFVRKNSNLLDVTF